MKKLDPERYLELVKIANDSIIHGLTHGAEQLIEPSTLHPDLLKNARIFVSLKWNNQLKGPVGDTILRPAFSAVRRNAFLAAFKDNRHPPLNKYRLDKFAIQIHHLYDLEQYRLIGSQELIKKIEPEHSISLTFGNFTATMLNSEQQEYSSDTQRFLNAIVNKAKIPAGTPWEKLTATFFRTYSTDSVLIKTNF
jgi:AMMECR1 domain-containing protein